MNLLPASSSRRRHRMFTSAVTVPLVALGVLLATPAVAAPDGGETAPTQQATIVGPTREEVAAQRAEADKQAAAADDLEKELAAARQAINDLQIAADQALRAHEGALLAHVEAEAENARQTLRLEAANRIVAERKGELGRWASQTYRSGGSMGDIEGFMTLLESDNSAELGQRAQMLDMVGRWRGSVVDTVEEAEAVQEDATKKADAAEEAANIAAAQAAAAKTLADTALTEQGNKVALLGALLRAQRDAAALAGAKTVEMEQARVDADKARAYAEGLRLAAAAGSRRDNRVTGPVGECQGLPVQGYSNGAIAAEALCPLWAGVGHRLRADAAHGFNQMSEAYAIEFGAPICVTDSYRSYQGQVAVYAARPHLAAVPGTSNHGWGTATDLCGGIQHFGSPQHEWMRANAPLYGFFHPAWAQQNGSRPEPWHWEYGT